MKVSIIIPVYNEQENLKILHQELRNVLDSGEIPYEIIWVNDGSKDGSLTVLNDIAKADINSKIIDFIHNFGQTKYQDDRRWRKDQSGLSTSGAPDAKKIDVKLSDNQLTLKGFVSSWREG